jgi:hypothetical protein
MSKLRQFEMPKVHSPELITPKDDFVQLMDKIYQITDMKTDTDVQRNAARALKKIDSLMQVYKGAPDTIEKINIVNDLKQLVHDIRRAVDKVDNARSAGDSKKDRQLHEALMEFLDQTLIETDEELRLNFFTE